MARDKDQIFIFTDAELSLIKTVFAENEELLYLIRKVLLQFELTKEEKKIVKAAVSKEVHDVLKKRIHPDISNDFPMGQIMDIYQTLTQDLKTKTPKEMEPIIEAKQLEVDYLDQQFRILRDVEANIKPALLLSDWASLDKDPYDAYVQTTARNFILGYVDPMLLLIKNIAGMKTEPVEEVKKRMLRNSNK